MRHAPSPFTRQWGWPLGLALLTLFGLMSALLGEGGIWWVLSWIALGLPLLVALRHILRARHSQAERAIRSDDRGQPSEDADISQLGLARSTRARPPP